ncbi:hypothetical protein Dsin_021944 [Dipteronia sinensis]|uniref:Pectinesterase inhibitor domain-containing protein n=1 Tax=Dipteronia sinensis TaxID=43782 RepID=A0AAE0A0N9_9ROSI|nr:hypothetical protein Dsin_021944 [Dipteronia sinensis]
MANPTCFYFHFLMLYVVVHVLFVDQNTVTATSNNEEVSLIKKSCNGTKFPDTCLSVLEADSRSRSATDLKSLTRISMDILYEEAVGLKSLFIKVKENVTDPDLKKKVSVCIDAFEFCNHNVKTFGIPDFEKGDYFHANADIGFCQDGAIDCTDTGINMFNREIETLANFTLDVLDFLNTLDSGKNM